VEGIEFRSLTVQAWKAGQEPCLDRSQAVIYKGPFLKVQDDDGHAMERGKRYAVCEKTFKLLQNEPYCACFEFIEPRTEVPLDSAPPFDCSSMRLRHPKETKGQDCNAPTEAANCRTTGDGTSCC